MIRQRRAGEKRHAVLRNVQYRVYSYAASGTLSAPGLTAIGRWF